MARINAIGNITAKCPGCNGATSTYEYQISGHEIGVIKKTIVLSGNPFIHHYRLFRCAGCGEGGIGLIKLSFRGSSYPGDIDRLINFYPEVKERLSLPENVPSGIKSEFREGETCFENGCNRAAAGMFRSVLDKTLRANGYKENRNTNLQTQIDNAATDGVITSSRRRRAHEEIRVLGNDVLHDEWVEIPDENIEVSRHYCQRLLEDFYDERESVLATLRESGRVPEEDKEEAEQDETG